MIRELVSRLSTTFTERRVSVRKKFHVPIKVSFAPEANTCNLKCPVDNSFLSGETTDLSETGVGFVVSSIRIKEKYLVGQDRVLNIELDLAGRRVHLQAAGRRYERVGMHASTERYLIGVEIIQDSSPDLQTYHRFLRDGKKLLKNVTPAFEMGVE
jgi:hypothetical protein